MIFIYIAPSHNKGCFMRHNMQAYFIVHYYII